MIYRKNRKAAALLMSMITLAMLSTWAVSISTISTTNLQSAQNHHKANSAQTCAESGLEVTRYWLSRVVIPGTIVESQRFSHIVSSLQSDLSSFGISPVLNGSTLTIPAVTLNTATSESFSATITSIDDNTVQLDITGTNGSISRTIRVNYTIGRRGHTVFNYGVATRGPLDISGNIQLEGVNISVESDVYIESEFSILALSIIGNSQIAGQVSVANPLATADLQGGQAGVGGETGQDAIDNHVDFGVPPTEFPVPNPSHFENYVINEVNSLTDTSANSTFDNVRIVAGTNPHFTGNITLNGVVFIETPNVVTFGGNAQITGIIVGDGDVEDDSGANQINFTGTVISSPVTALPEEAQYTDIKGDTGTFLMAPGFASSFSGNFATLNGAIVSNGVQFSGNAGGTINGSVINYADTPTELSGNSDLLFNRSGASEMPSGFEPEYVLVYQSDSYSELIY
jgi:hypothetical protein